MAKPEIYVSIDIETDGPAPGLTSMLSPGAIALTPGQPESEAPRWYATLEPLYGAYQHLDTMKWWKTQPEAWDEVNSNQRDADSAMEEFADWVEALPGKPIAVAWPAAFDFAFVNYYLHRFAGRNPLGFSCLDIRSYANGLAEYNSYHGLSESLVRSMAGEVDTSDLRDHVALDDAIGQGRLFMKLLQYVTDRKARR
jgi:DNA polymerase III alpha subunit (gram-positive type)